MSVISRTVRRCLGDDQGAAVILFAIMIVPLLLAMGLAIDYSRMDKRRQSDQAALDSAVISALARDGKAITTQSVAQFYKENGGSGEISQLDVQEANGVVSASAQSSSVAQFIIGRIAGFNEAEINVRSEAKSPMRLTEMKIEPDHASGWFIKTLKLYATMNGDPAPKLLGTVKYRPSAPTSSTGTMTDDFGGGWVSIENANQVWFEMEIDPSSAGVAGYRLDLATNDPETSHHLFVDGVQMPKGRVINLAEMVPCNVQTRHAWEDGGNFDTQDFFYTVTGKCDVGGSGVAFLSK